jgi:hypothetical protein
MSLAEPPSPFSPDAEELKKLQHRWDAGAYAEDLNHLIDFVRERKDLLMQAAGGSGSEADYLKAVRALLIQFGSVDARTEMLEQLQLIQDEIWYCGERGDYDRARIVEDWTRQHAAAWRRWRLIEYLFVLERGGYQILTGLGFCDEIGA